ncbi:MAG: phosphomethylpyrimidine synthase ThiC, partial [Bacteroidales bacterium]
RRLPCRGLAAGRIVIPANPRHGSLRPVGIGEGLSVKVNVNLGRSPTTSCLTEEVSKVEAAVRYGADAVMDLSTGPDIDAVREAVIGACTVPMGTVPVYQAAEEVDAFEDLPEDRFLWVLEHQARQGVDFMTIHAGILRAHLGLVDRRVTGISNFVPVSITKPSNPPEFVCISNEFTCNVTSASFWS